MCNALATSMLEHICLPPSRSYERIRSCVCHGGQRFWRTTDFRARITASRSSRKQFVEGICRSAAASLIQRVFRGHVGRQLASARAVKVRVSAHRAQTDLPITMLPQPEPIGAWLVAQVVRMVTNRMHGVEYYINIASGRKVWHRPRYISCRAVVPLFEVPKTHHEIHSLCSQCPAGATQYCRACLMAFCDKCCK